MSLLYRLRRGMTGHRQLLSNVAWQGVAQICARLLNLAIFFLVANVLGAQGLGQFVFALTFAQAVGVFVDFGMHPILVREAVKGESWGLFRTFSLLKLGLALLAGSAALAAGRLLFGLRGSDLLSIALGLGAIFGLSYLGLLFSLFRARQQMMYEALFTFVHRLAYFLLALLALATWATANGVLAAYAASGLLAVIAVYAFVRRRYGHPGSQAVPLNRELLGQIAPLLVIDFWTLIYFRVDTLMLQVMKGYAEVGVYGAAYRVFEALIIVPSVLAIALFPRLVKDVAVELRGKNVGLYFSSFVLLGVVGAAVLYALSAPILGLLYGPGGGFAASAGIFRLLLIAFVVVCVNYPLTQIAIASGRQKAYAFGVVAAGLVNIGLNLFAIPRYGAAGAAAVTIATELCLLLFLQGQLRQAWAGTRQPTWSPGV
jgi:O-antigen/teichoic acid export membrane protein